MAEFKRDDIPTLNSASFQTTIEYGPGGLIYLWSYARRTGALGISSATWTQLTGPTLTWVNLTPYQSTPAVGGWIALPTSAGSGQMNITFAQIAFIPHWGWACHRLEGLDLSGGLAACVRQLTNTNTYPLQTLPTSLLWGMVGAGTSTVPPLDQEAIRGPFDRFGLSGINDFAFARDAKVTFVASENAGSQRMLEFKGDPNPGWQDAIIGTQVA